MEIGSWERGAFSPAVWIKPRVEIDERHAPEKLAGSAIRRTWAFLPGWNFRRVNEMTEIIRQYGVLRWRGSERASLTSCANAKTTTTTLIQFWRTWTKGILRWNWKLTHHEQLMWKFNQWQTYNNAYNGKSLSHSTENPTTIIQTPASPQVYKIF